MTKTQFDGDILIAGAGPAGASAAIHLARAGLQVILADYQVFPRDKVCGDFVSPVGLNELRRLGIHTHPDFKASYKIHEAAVYLDGEHLVTSEIPRSPGLKSYGRVIPRLALDGWIVDQARRVGVRVLEGHRVEDYHLLPDGIQVSVRSEDGLRSLYVRVLIGADGSTSRVARLLRGEGFQDEDRIIAVRGYYEGIKKHGHRAGIFFSSSSFPGYYWVFPVSKTVANVGVGMALKTVPPNNDHLRELLLQLIREDPALKEYLGEGRFISTIHGWPLSIYNLHNQIVGERVLLVGDAAGLINPLNGEGIQYALLSGRWAAEALKTAVGRDDFSEAVLSAYADRVAGELRYDMVFARAILQLIRNRGLNIVWLEALKMITTRAKIDPDYAAVTGGVLAGLVPAHRVASLNIITKTVQQAALSIGLQAARQAMKGPTGLLKFGVDATNAAIEIVSTMLNSRDESIQWGAGTLQSALALTGEVSREIIRSRQSLGNRSRNQEPDQPNSRTGES